MTQPQRVPAGAGAPRPPGTSAQRVVGLVLLLPAVLAWIAYQVMPVLRTFWFSLHQSGLEGADTFTGLENFGNVPRSWYTGAVVQLVLGLAIAAVAVTVGLLLGGLVRRAPDGWQRISLAVAGLGLVSYAPLNLMFVTYWSYGTPLGVRLLLAMVPIPLLIGVIAAALSRSGRLLLVIGAVTALGGAAWALQGEIGILLSISPEQPPGMFIYRATFAAFDVGTGAAASMIMGLLLGALGLGAALMLLAIRPRFDLTGAARGGAAAPGPYPVTMPGRQGSAGSSGLGILAVAAAVVLLVVLVILALPWLPHLGSSAEGLDPATSARATWSTLGRRALELVLTLLVTGAAAVGLGYCRPFGRHSVRALLVFSPWLFVGLIPLMTGLYLRFSGPPAEFAAPFFGITVQMLAVPLLFLLTYLADGARTARDAGARLPVGSVAGLVVLGLGLITLVRGQEVVWDLVFLYDRANSALQMVFQVLSMQFGQTIPLGLLTPPVLLLLGALVLAGAAALLPGIHLLPAEELARQQAGQVQLEAAARQAAEAQHGPAHWGQPPYGQSQPAQQPGSWPDPHR